MLNFLIAGLLLLLSHQPALAGSDDTVTFQGIVNSTEGIPGHLIINERKVLLDERVEVRDHKEKDKSLSDIKNGKWIYVVSKETLSGPNAIRVYLLPGNVKHGEKHKYPFMHKEEDDD
ncbi:MAG: hypothetical protein A2132_06395 [Nitrospirae bacterium RBG_16_43_11]|nr:MAG: hypothetical protein A2132_06395 [Nitrospirae bacterium RBG_16_43_11]